MDRCLALGMPGAWEWAVILAIVLLIFGRPRGGQALGEMLPVGEGVLAGRVRRAGVRAGKRGSR